MAYVKAYRRFESFFFREMFSESADENLLGEQIEAGGAQGLSHAKDVGIRMNTKRCETIVALKALKIAGWSSW